MFDRNPPFDEAAETSVIASLLVDPAAATKVAPIVQAGDFFREQHAWTYAACMALWERGETVGQVTVAHELDRRGQLEDVGGLAYLSDLIMDLPTPVGVEHFAAIVKRDAMYRKMIAASYKIAEVAYQGGPNIDDAIAKAEAAVYALRSEIPASEGFVRLSDVLGVVSEAPATEAVMPRSLQVVRTGLRALDALMRGGLKGGSVTYVGAHTSQGKTALMCNIARNAAVAQNARVAIFTLEMSAEELAARILASDARISTDDLERFDYEEDQYHRLWQALAILGNAEVYIDASAALTPSLLRTKCLSLASEKGLDLAVIDYLGLMEPDRETGNRNTDVGKITREIKTLASEMDIAFIVGSQLNRANEGKVPAKADLRDSGNIEQDATNVIFIHREEVYVSREAWEQAHADELNEPYPTGVAQLFVAKQRNGPIGACSVRYRGRYTRFEDFDPPASAPVQGGIPDFMLNGAH